MPIMAGSEFTVTKAEQTIMGTGPRATPRRRFGSIHPPYGPVLVPESENSASISDS